MTFQCSLCGTLTDEDHSPFGEGFCLSCAQAEFDAIASAQDTEQNSESFPCAHCGEETFFDYSSSGDLLCESCAIDQDTFDSGICPTCGAPSNDDGECFFCS